MPRPKRITKGNIVYHTLNRANGRLRIFKKARDYDGSVRFLLPAMNPEPEWGSAAFTLYGDNPANRIYFMALMNHPSYPGQCELHIGDENLGEGAFLIDGLA